MMDGQDDMYKGDDNTALRFYEEAVKNNFQTEKQGRPVFDTALFVEVLTPGSTESIPKFELERTYCQEASGEGQPRMVEKSPRYAQYEKQIEAYKSKSGDFVTNGTPIAKWPVIDTGTAATLKAMGISTVEMLASVSDGNLQNLGTGGRVLRDQAKAHLQTQTFGLPTAQMAAESANLREENVRLQNQVADLTQRLGSLTEEVQQLRVGAPPAIPAPGGPGTDPFSLTTQSQIDPLATTDGTSASPLTPTEGEAAENAKKKQTKATKPAEPLI